MAAVVVPLYFCPFPLFRTLGINESMVYEDHLNEVGVRAAIDSKLEEHRSVIKVLRLEGKKKLATFFKVAKNFF